MNQDNNHDSPEALQGATVLLVLAAVLVVLGLRPPRNRPGRTVPARGSVAPSAG